METLCKIRDIYRSIVEFESGFEKMYGICLNEGMLLCSLVKEGKLSSGELAERMGLSLSNTSKVIKSVEDKSLITRILGDRDKRQMYFSLTKEGESRMKKIMCQEIELPVILNQVIDTPATS